MRGMISAACRAIATSTALTGRLVDRRKTESSSRCRLTPSVTKIQ
jgi:hypothetical protein